MLLTFDAEAHRYYWDGKPVPGVTTILAPLSDFAAVDPDVMRRASKFGTAVHYVCELVDTGEDLQHYDVDPALLPYVDAWRKFCAEWRVQWKLIEQRVYHPTLRYAGTLDRKGTLVAPGEPEHRRHAAVVDIKTSTNLYPSVGPQLAAYARADDPLNGASQRRYAVQLKGDGSYVCKEYRDADDFATFSALLALRTWCSRHSIKPQF
ncbi:hypothetical protein [Variovorax sp. DXTD-1]|uniref:hypothetical protein n=1 Tax=Variovorax sp. DXTD-1 TaxID=2495592 RepID=UPI000F87A089|nr:hypothetical protein [Variovorax sp. DXTD-1]RST54133.1 hypothetical protein EJI00_03125 [Variovorax sp. DXTD-1]